MPRGKPSQAASDQGHDRPEHPFEVMTYTIRPTENAKELTIVVRCGLCNRPLLAKDLGWCANCTAFPVNVTPRRLDAGGHKVGPAGYCGICARFVLSRMEPTNGEWYDTGEVGRFAAKEENQANAKRLQAVLAGPGWPEKRVPLRRDVIPRSWRRKSLAVVDTTPLGFDVVLPADERATQVVNEVPF